jgi:hypothetical protein
MPYTMMMATAEVIVEITAPACQPDDRNVNQVL